MANERRIDEIARALATALPRRRFAAGIAAATVASPGGGQFGAAAGCKKVGRRCDEDGDCCDGVRCRQGVCACRGSREECDGLCFKLNRDEAHCGACGRACGPDQLCANSRCV